ncbi:MAG: oxygenase MpaB family protein, partial [Gordonia sp. (in: high G+C Gram-positive bacteria)]
MELTVSPRHRALHDRVRRIAGVSLLPNDDVVAAFAAGHTAGDPVAERFVAETYHGPMGGERARELLDDALRLGIDAVPDAPESMRRLFDEFETVPDWVRPELIEQGAAVWRRWGYSLGAVGNAGTMDTYTEGSLAVPLSLSGGYAGHSALHRYLETTRWWMEVCSPGAVLTPGSTARELSLKVRVMHVSVRARVAGHPEWDADRHGLPISQSEM